MKEYIAYLRPSTIVALIQDLTTEGVDKTPEIENQIEESFNALVAHSGIAQALKLLTQADY